ncbi:choline transport protein [Diplodia corticola]|uniref:Choline transport protein n=1 Tax=Diplodia corticola TaxID=236234 RepID=A0A1J9RA89_9PEZI|nr:choline transport protein [Diplodia corticola]OJD29331.1 choline transport protein [Diplodia corticola]
MASKATLPGVSPPQYTDITGHTRLSRGDFPPTLFDSSLPPSPTIQSIVLVTLGPYLRRTQSSHVLPPAIETAIPCLSPRLAPLVQQSSLAAMAWPLTWNCRPVLTAVSPVTGHVDELRCEFNVWSLCALLVCLMGTWEALTSAVAQALTNGGAPCLLYNYIIAFIGTLLTAASLTEIASIYPTAGGQYRWVASLAPSHTRLVASWFTGWINIDGQVVLTASAAFAAGLQFQALIVLNDASGTYVPQRCQDMLFYWDVIAYSTAINIFGSRVLPHHNTLSGIGHVVGFIAAVFMLGIMDIGMEGGHGANYIFKDVDNTHQWMVE